LLVARPPKTSLLVGTELASGLVPGLETIEDGGKQEAGLTSDVPIAAVSVEDDSTLDVVLVSDVNPAGFAATSETAGAITVSSEVKPPEVDVLADMLGSAKYLLGLHRAGTGVVGLPSPPTETPSVLCPSSGELPVSGAPEVSSACAQSATGMPLLSVAPVMSMASAGPENSSTPADSQIEPEATRTTGSLAASDVPEEGDSGRALVAGMLGGILALNVLKGSLVLETLPVSNSLLSEVALVTAGALVASDAGLVLVGEALKSSDFSLLLHKLTPEILPVAGMVIDGVRPLIKLVAKAAVLVAFEENAEAIELASENPQGRLRAGISPATVLPVAAGAQATEGWLLPEGSLDVAVSFTSIIRVVFEAQGVSFGEAGAVSSGADVPFSRMSEQLVAVGVPSTILLLTDGIPSAFRIQSVEALVSSMEADVPSVATGVSLTAAEVVVASETAQVDALLAVSDVSSVTEDVLVLVAADAVLAAAGVLLVPAHVLLAVGDVLLAAADVP
jgi:hypothetical protein